MCGSPDVLVHAYCMRLSMQVCQALLHMMMPSVSSQVWLGAGWALCGHETPAGQAQGTQAGSTQCVQEAAHQPASPHKPETNCIDSPYAATPAAGNCLSNTADCAESCPTVIQLSRDERIVLGQKCKQLIDAGRVDWLLQQGFQAGFHCCLAVNMASWMTAQSCHDFPA